MATSAELIDLIKDGIRQAAERDAASFGAAYYPTHARGVQSGYERALRIINRIAAGQDWTGRPRPTTKETSMLIDIDRLRSPLGHEYLPIEGHEDDNHCARVLNGGQQCGQAQDAHHVPADVEEYLNVMAERLEDPAQETGHDIATWFSLSYSNYLVIPRVLLEHMPQWWQQELVGRLEQLDAAYDHIDRPEEFEVHPCRWVAVDDLTADDAKTAGVTSSLDDVRIPPLPEHPTEEQFGAHQAAWEEAHSNAVFHDADGNELDRHQRVAVRVPDPLPHYRHGRVEPRGLPGGGGR